MREQNINIFFFKSFNPRVNGNTNFQKIEIMESIVIYVGVFELSRAFNGKVEVEHLWEKIWKNKGIHIQIILKLTKNCRITLFFKLYFKINI